MKYIIYKCSAGHVSSTQCDILEAVLPMFIECTVCRELATATESTENTKATHEWFIPEKRGKGITKEDKRRYKKHGVFLRVIANAAISTPEINLEEYMFELTTNIRTSSAKFEAGQRFKKLEHGFECTTGQKLFCDENLFKILENEKAT